MKRGVILALVVAAYATAIAGSGGARPAAAECGSAPAFDPGRLGSLAYWQAGALRVVDVASGKRRVVYTPPRRTMAGTPLAGSPDGRWLAAGAHLIPVAGGKPCLPLGAGARALSFAPAEGRIAGESRLGAVLVGSPSARTQVVVRSRFGVQSVDPSGTRLAFSTLTGRSLWAVDLASGRRRLLYESPSDAVGPPTNEGWSPDGRWVFFQTDGYSSSSIAADGLPLLAVPARGGRPIRIEQSVLRADLSVRPCGGRSLVVSAGSDRYVSANKQIDIVAPPAWKAANLSHDPRGAGIPQSARATGKWSPPP
jgi:Tol biopolymer transport system component